MAIRPYLPMDYLQATRYLHSFINYENLYNYSYKKSFKLIRFKEFLKAIGDPQSGLKIIHVAGSKGKGSVCVFIANILKQSGFKVGLYTSPHLVDFRERVRILDKGRSREQKPAGFEGMITRREVCRLVEKLRLQVEGFDKEAEYGHLTFFEVYTAVALRYFKEKRVDFVVLETGLGGRLDATNACSAILSVITPLSLEHTYLLGKGIKQIAYEKASIIKAENQRSARGKVIALTSKQPPQASAVIRKICRSNNAELFQEGKDFFFHRKGKRSFDYQGLERKLENLKIGLSGGYQMANAALAVASTEALSYHNVDIGSGAIRLGLKDSVWPARFEIVSKDPTIILDGAQNGASVRALRNTLREEFPRSRVWVIFGIARDKELKDTCAAIESVSGNIVLTKSENPRASEPDRLSEYFRSSKVYISDSLSSALGLVRSIAHRKDVILITGSLYLCGEAKLLLGGHQDFLKDI